MTVLRVWLHTCYKEGGLQCNMGPSEAAADTPVGPGVPGLDLGDQQCAVGEQDHTGGGEQNCSDRPHRDTLCYMKVLQ